MPGGRLFEQLPTKLRIVRSDTNEERSGRSKLESEKSEESQESEESEASDERGTAIDTLHTFDVFSSKMCKVLANCFPVD